MRYFKTSFLMGMITIFSLDFLSAQATITSCNADFMDSGGISSDYLNNENSDWLICPDTITEYLEIEFTHVNIETASNEGVDSTGCRDVLTIYDGIDNSASIVGVFCGEESGSGKSSFISGHTLTVGDKFKPTNEDGCFYITFQSNDKNSLSGWNAQVTCCTPTLTNGNTDGIDTPIAQNGGQFVDITVDNRCIRKGNLSSFTEFESTGNSCFTKGLSLPNQSFYAFESNGTGGFIEMMLSPVDSVGQMEMLIYGPVQLDNESYTGGVINVCLSANTATSTFFNAGPNQTYILALATELEGQSMVNTLSSSQGLGGVLPVELAQYGVRKEASDAVIEWTTLQENNNAGFEIMKSHDGKNFEAIAWVESNYNSSQKKSYQYRDSSDKYSTIYYQIKQIDQDGVSQLYDILSVEFTPIKEISIYPNPSNGHFSVNIDNDDNIAFSLKVYNQMGQLLDNITTDSKSIIDLSHLNSGIYTFQIINGKTITTKQHVIRK